MGFSELNSRRFPRRGRADGPGGKFFPLLLLNRKEKNHKATANRTNDPNMSDRPQPSRAGVPTADGLVLEQKP